MNITRIFRSSEGHETTIGHIDGDFVIYREHFADARPVGRVDETLHVLRASAHVEQEVGYVLATGAIHAAGLFEGGPLGWMDPDGVVIRGGMILGEEEVGRVEGPHALAAAGALLLILLPDEEESDRRNRR